MSVDHLLPVLQALPREDKLRLVQFLVGNLAQEEGLKPLKAQTEHPIWSPHGAYEAADALLGVLEAEKGRHNG